MLPLLWGVEYDDEYLGDKYLEVYFLEYPVMKQNVSWEGFELK